jgi:DNA helicase-2/ATP-dependent DNA helicase PcrA
MANPNDQMAFERVADYCLSGVGSKSVAKITQMTSSVDLMTAAKSFSEGGSKQALAVRTFLSAMDAAKSMSPGAGVTSVLHATGFWNKISEKNNDKTGLDRHENINEVTSDVDEYLGKSESNTVAGYLQEVSLLTSTDEEQKDNEVSLMTIHAAKGLEFEVVIISHVNQEIIPHWNALNPSDPSMRNREIEEERRLMYVAMTRSKKWLYLALCQTRFNKTMKPSQFISEAGLY